MALLGREEIADFADCSPEFIDGSCGSFSQVGLELGEGHLDRVEVGAVGRQEQKPCALFADERLGFRAFVAGQIVEDDDVAL